MFSFGTDGYRAIIADGFDFQTVGKLTQGLAAYLKQEKPKPQVLIGFDTRFLSDKFAAYSAHIAVQEGLNVEIANRFLPTPFLSYAITDKGADAGIVITASHNPYYYNGFKIKNAQGGSASAEQIAAIEPYLNNNQPLAEHKFHNPLPCKTFDAKDSYFNHLGKVVPKEKLHDTGLKIVADPLYGAGRGYFKELLESYSFEVEEIHGEDNPDFGGLHPEPIGENLKELKEKVLESGADIGLALDGDADRSGVIDEKGNFVNSHQIFALLLYYLVEHKKRRGVVAKTYSTTSLVDIMANAYGLEVIQTPIGFKHISNLMLTKDILIGGEESGGIGIKGHIPERDGMLIGLMLTELMAETGKTINELIKVIYAKFGHFAYHRIDKIIEPSSKENLYKHLHDYNIAKLVNKNLRQLLNQDGYKYEFEDRSWLMFRLSGTESVVRIYAEADNSEEVNRLLTCGDELVTQLTNA